jgi:hypothetical protein
MGDLVLRDERELFQSMQWLNPAVLFILHTAYCILHTACCILHAACFVCLF